MTEKQIKEALDFLVKDYNLEYDFQRFESCPFGNWCTETYSYFNKYGCFTITNLLTRDDVSYIHLDDIKLLKMDLSINVQSKNTQNLRQHIFRFSEPEVVQHRQRRRNCLQLMPFTGCRKKCYTGYLDGEIKASAYF